MKPTLLLFTIILFIPFYLAQAEEISLYNQLLTVNKYWAEQETTKSLKETYSSLKSTQLIQTHLLLVEKKLRNESTSHLTIHQARKRAKALNDLKKYALKGTFPINLHHSVATPYFIDDYGTNCAVGQLIFDSDHKALALKIKAANNFAYIEEMNFPSLNQWASEHGFTKKELMWIQPGYGPACAEGEIKDPICPGGYGCFNFDYEADSLVPPYAEKFEYNNGSGWVTDTVFRWGGRAAIGDHRVTVTDSNNKVKVYLATINDIPAWDIDTSTTNAQAGICNGTANLSVTNYNGSFNYTLVNQQLNFYSSNTTGIFDSLCAATYSLTVGTNFNCLTSLSLTIDQTTSLSSNGLEGSSYFKNPFNNVLKAYNIKNPITFQLYSASGQLIKEGVITKSGVNTNELSEGIYILRYIEGQQRFSKKLIKSN